MVKTKLDWTQLFRQPALQHNQVQRLGHHDRLQSGPAIHPLLPSSVSGQQRPV